MVSFLLLAGMSGTTAAHAEEGTVGSLPDITTYRLTAEKDLRAGVAAGLKANGSLDPVNLKDLAGKGKPGKDGLCYPEPFHPGVHADGYCWDNSDDNGNSGWTPQGFSIPHSKNADSDGLWPVDQAGVAPRRWDVVSMHNEEIPSLLKFRFVDRNEAKPLYFDVLLVNVEKDGTTTPVRGHGDSVVWYGDNLLMGTGGALNVFSLDNLQYSENIDGTFGYRYVIPLTLQYRTPAAANQACVAFQGDAPCLTSLSFDRENSALLSSEFEPKPKPPIPADTVNGGRVVRWSFDVDTWLPKTSASGDFGNSTGIKVWRAPFVGMQGAVFAAGNLYISASCPRGYLTGYREPACIYQVEPDGKVSILTSAPDMTQNLDWNAKTKRLHGVNEVAQTADKALPQRLVFELDRTAAKITTFRLKNVLSQKCLFPWATGLNDNLTVVQGDCNGQNAQDWYAVGDQIVNFQSKRCLSVRDGSSAPNAVLVQFDCRGYPTQNWGRAASTKGGAQVTNLGSGLCLAINNASVQQDAPAVQWHCNTDAISLAWVGSAKNAPWPWMP
ncbi:RICIN domain-containing protein [Streptomyces sp. WAC07149]|uniref:RICIN domain-containing protein n=1 Tax=Streptomyces sp. WAC07149 TaxID=2487425 RepID=UPI00163C80E6|nr:RICIN domain-containing protein [Streptomyces sp. WAC07149]